MNQVPQVYMETQNFVSFDRISIPRVLSAFITACDTNGIPEGAALWLFHSFMTHSEYLAFNTRIKLRSKLHKQQKERTVTLNCEAVNYFFKTLETDDVFAKTVADMMRYFSSRVDILQNRQKDCGTG